MYPPILRVHLKKRSAKDLSNDSYAMFLCVFFLLIFSIKHMLWVQVDAFQMATHNICLYKEVEKNYTGCNLKTTEVLDCALIGACVVIRSNTVCFVI